MGENEIYVDVDALVKQSKFRPFGFGFAIATWTLIAMGQLHEFFMALALVAAFVTLILGIISDKALVLLSGIISFLLTVYFFVELWFFV